MEVLKCKLKILVYDSPKREERVTLGNWFWLAELYKYLFRSVWLDHENYAFQHHTIMIKQGEEKMMFNHHDYNTIQYNFNMSHIVEVYGCEGFKDSNTNLIYRHSLWTVAPTNFICVCVCLVCHLSCFYPLYLAYYGSDFDQSWWKCWNSYTHTDR